MARVLIVDDIPVFRETFRQALLERFPSHEVAEAVDGDDALDKVNRFNPDLIFMDIRLPGANGLTLTGRIKAMRPDIAVIILTDYDLPEYREAALQEGADEFMAKGALKMSAIERMVMRHLRGDGEDLHSRGGQNT
jgi:DNA-binding NarL/FixJ family response regulator